MAFKSFVTIDDRQLRTFINQLPIKVTKSFRDAGREFCYAVRKSTRMRLSRRGHNFEFFAWNSLQVLPKGKTEHVLYISQEALWLDSMRPHVVQLERGSAIHRWALIKGNATVKRIAAREGHITVKPSPYLEDSFNAALSKFDPIVKRAVDKAIN